MNKIVNKKIRKPPIPNWAWEHAIKYVFKVYANQQPPFVEIDKMVKEYAIKLVENKRCMKFQNELYKEFNKNRVYEYDN